MTLQVLLDPAVRAALVGATVRLSRLRHKPGLSTTAAVHHGDGPADSWVQVVTGEHRVKIDNLRRRAERLGVEIRVTHGDGLIAAAGPIGADARLGKLLARLPEGERQTLSYNPHKRLVAREGDEVLRLTRHPQPDWEALTAGLPAGVARPRRCAGSLSRWPHIAGHRLDDPGTAELTGRLLAALHTATAPGVPRWDAQSMLVPAKQADRMLPDLQAAATLRPLADWAAHHPLAVLAHGDFSADQIVVDAGSRPHLIDLDRLCRAPAGLDLGTFTAVAAQDPRQAELSAALMAGYGPVPHLGRWTAVALALRLLDPLRSAPQDWADQVRSRLREVRRLWHS